LDTNALTGPKSFGAGSEAEAAMGRGNDYREGHQPIPPPLATTLPPTSTRIACSDLASLKGKGGEGGQKGEDNEVGLNERRGGRNQVGVWFSLLYFFG